MTSPDPTQALRELAKDVAQFKMHGGCADGCSYSHSGYHVLDCVTWRQRAQELVDRLMNALREALASPVLGETVGEKASQEALAEVMGELRMVGEILKARPEQSVIDAAREVMLALDLSESGALDGRRETLRKVDLVWCDNCGVQFPVISDERVGQRFCSSICMAEWTAGNCR